MMKVPRSLHDLRCPPPASPQDSGIVVESFKSGFEPPGDFPFEDFSQNLSRTGSDGAISNTPKGERDREGPPGPRSDPKHPMGRPKNKLWLFGKKPKVNKSKRDTCVLEFRKKRKEKKDSLSIYRRKKPREAKKKPGTYCFYSFIHLMMQFLYLS